MLSEIMMMGTTIKKDPGRLPGLSCSSLFPCPTYLYKAQKEQVWTEEPDPQQILNMEDGWDQEEQTVRRLKERKVEVICRDPKSRRVVIGKSNIPGSFDGVVILNKTKYLWEHKAMSIRNFELLRTFGLEAFPNYKAQVQGYMLGANLSSCIFMAKEKDSNNYFDLIEKFNPDFIFPIVDWADRIRLEEWVPIPEENKYCKDCKIGCFRTSIQIDFSSITPSMNEEMENQWRKGKALKQMGESLEATARDFFISSMGESRFLTTGTLEVVRQDSKRIEINKKKLLDLVGPDIIVQVMEEKPITSYRFKDIS